MYLIGLTGNIATGKSTVCHILEQLGARIIDADLVAHAVLKRGTPAWRSVVEQFGYDILHYDGAIDRRKLGALIFGDASKLQTLERITHPAIGTELALLVRDAAAAPNAAETIVVIEAVKLYEAGLHEYLDALWVVTAPPEEQKRRLIQDRGLSEPEIKARLDSQPALDEKLKRANVVIDNGGSIEETRVQVMRGFIQINTERARDKTALLTHWLRLTPQATPPPAETLVETMPPPILEHPLITEPEWTVRRARPTDARMLSELLAKIEGKSEPIGRAEMLERQGRFGYWMVRAGERTVALAAWQAENLAAIVRELWADTDEQAVRAFPVLLQAIEAEANALTCEVVAIVVPERASHLAEIAARAGGYVPTTPDQLHKLWRTVIAPLLTGQETLYTKQLREIVTKPI
ncbi:MAG: dephospho-CoA kinase [Chloroflexi bacterium]|nr:dephospho-CoA kinase [Chloroflexota bacterium]